MTEPMSDEAFDEFDEMVHRVTMAAMADPKVYEKLMRTARAEVAQERQSRADRI